MQINKTIKTVICDDHHIFRVGLKEILKNYDYIEIIAEANNGVELTNLVLKSEPDIIIIDYYMPGKNGAEVTKEILQLDKGFKVIALTMSNEEEQIINMIEAGALGFINKANDCAELFEAIKVVNEGKPYFSKDVAEKITYIIANQHHIKKITPTFTDREIDIIRLICFECTSKEIAFKLKLSRRTVEGHRTRIMDKLGARSIAGIITYALSANIIDASILKN